MNEDLDAMQPDWHQAYQDLQDELEQILLAFAAKMDQQGSGSQHTKIARVVSDRINEKTIKFNAIIHGKPCKFSFSIFRDGNKMYTTPYSYDNSHTVGNLTPGKYYAKVTATPEFEDQLLALDSDTIMIGSTHHDS